MEGLGVLRRLSDTGNYSLRNQSLLPLIGSKSEIEGYLLSEHEKPLEYKPARYRRQVKQDKSEFLAPLSDGQISTLLRPVPSTIVLSGTQLSELDRAETFLRRIDHFIDRFQQPEIVEGQQSPQSFEDQLRKMVGKQSKQPNKQLVIVVPSTQIWNWDWLKASERTIRRYLGNKSKSTKGSWPLHVVFIADEHVLWSLISESRGGLSQGFSELGIDFWGLSSWGKYELKQLKDLLRRGWTERQIEEIQAHTSGWPALIRRTLAKLSRKETESPEEILHSMEGLVEAGDRAGQSLLQAITEIPQASEVLSAMARYGDELDQEEILELMDRTIPDDLLDHIMEWASLLGYVRLRPRGLRVIDPAVSKLILHQTVEGE